MIHFDRDRDGMRLLRTSQRLDHPRERVFPFFADATNLQRITPPSLRFTILTPPPLEMRAGLLIDYALRVHGLPVRWRTAITEWDPPRRFVDEQQRGPYRYWRHEHTFTRDGDATIVNDVVRYRVPGGEFVHRLLVARELRRIFVYRGRVMTEVFPPRARRRGGREPVPGQV